MYTGATQTVLEGTHDRNAVTVPAQRLYANGKQRRIQLKVNEILPWMDYNRLCRPGCALYVEKVRVSGSVNFRAPQRLPEQKGRRE